MSCATNQYWNYFRSVPFDTGKSNTHIYIYIYVCIYIYKEEEEEEEKKKLTEKNK